MKKNPIQTVEWTVHRSIMEYKTGPKLVYCPDTWAEWEFMKTRKGLQVRNIYYICLIRLPKLIKQYQSYSNEWYCELFGRSNKMEIYYNEKNNRFVFKSSSEDVPTVEDLRDYRRRVLSVVDSKLKKLNQAAKRLQHIEKQVKNHKGPVV